MDSSRVYQGVTGNLEPDFIEALQRVAVNGVVPDCTLILDIPAEIGLERARRRASAAAAPDRFEKEEMQTHEKRREAFLDIAARDPGRCHVIDAQRPEDAIADEIAGIIEERLTLADDMPASSPEVAQ
ncbi:Thymidylate kinase, putative [Ricinus communis]|uniref:Thymidylate kinase, putative n=1 Tax=Ricinus communis TaxID=3988 RepID=B9TQL2_RICCO|nr:Thymidylate kinase, putative [Ricinus communis]